MVAISETVLVLAGGTAVLSILFGMRVAMRALAGGAAVGWRSDRVRPMCPASWRCHP